jgi:gamma-glutamylcyclotransferase (GGCT)/AIG2-like uncharacterized protein YtfP
MVANPKLILFPSSSSSNLPDSHIHVFVYGTLKPGGRYHNECFRGRIAAMQEAIALGTLYNLPHLGYPAMTHGNDPVYGFVISFSDPAVLNDLDELEGYDATRSPSENEYDRQRIEIFTPERFPLGTAWVYLMSCERIQDQGGILLLQGTWEVNL